MPVASAGTDSPTFGDGVTTNSSQQAWIGARFGETDAPVSVTLAAIILKESRFLHRIGWASLIALGILLITLSRG